VLSFFLRWNALLLLAFALPVAADTGWLPGPSQPEATTGLIVDATRRNAVVSFWHCIYAASGGYEGRIGWTGGYSGCNAGTTARAFHDDVQRRINFMRALAGLGASVRVNDASTVYLAGFYNPDPTVLRSTAAQEAALMMAKHRDAQGDPVVTHTPHPDFECFTTAAGNACLRGNLAYTFFGPGAIDEYMRENDAAGISIWSTMAGHRRWLLLPGATSFATGDTPGDGGVWQATNILYVVQPPEELMGTAARFTAWPSPGFFPKGLHTRVWSLSYPGADFSNATVSMVGPSGPVDVEILDRTNTDFGDAAIVWKIPAGAESGSEGGDASYHVSVDGIAGRDVPKNHAYAVTVIDPDRLNESMALTGSGEPPPAGANYFFESVDLAESRRVEIGRRVAATWTEGAESSPAPRVVDGTSGRYSLLSSMSDGQNGNFWRSGQRAFRLAFADYRNPPGEDWFLLDHELVTGDSPRLSLHYRRGYSRSSRVVIETSVDGGLSWQEAGRIDGRTNNQTDNGFTLLSVPLPANQPAVWVVFRHVWTGDVFFSVEKYPKDPVGIFIDDITVSDVGEMETAGSLILDGDAEMLRFDSSLAGETLVPGTEYRLRVGASIGGHEFPFGPVKVITVSGAPLDGFDGWMAYDYPVLSGGFGDDDDGDGMSNGVEYAFGSNPLIREKSEDRPEIDASAGVFRLRRALADPKADVVYSAETSPDMSNWTSEGVDVFLADGELTAEIPLGSARRFLRWRVLRK
jgi:hypothetical protein